MIATPAAGNTVPTTVDWCADNSCFTPGRYPGDTAYVRWLGQRADRARRCAFATAPDIPFVERHRIVHPGAVEPRT